MTYITLITLVNNNNSLANSDGAAKKGKTTKRKKKTRTHPHTPDGLNVFHKKFRLSVPQVLDQSEISKNKQKQKQKRGQPRKELQLSVFCVILLSARFCSQNFYSVNHSFKNLNVSVIFCRIESPRYIRLDEVPLTAP